MGALDILVKIQESGGNALSSVFRTCGTDAKNLGRNVDEAATASTALDTALDKVDGQGLKETAGKAKRLKIGAVVRKYLQGRFNRRNSRP